MLDVIIALFGGIAGIVSISRQGQTNAIPGVAIATALMPPLCTAGFGIATANWTYFFGAFYLFFINAVFISLATYLIVRYLQFPEKKFANTKDAKLYRRWFIILSIVGLSPSIYFLYTVYRDEVIKKDIQQFVLSPIERNGKEILKWEVVKNDTLQQIKVYHSGRQLSDSLKQSIDSILYLHDMKTYHLFSIRVNLTKEEVSALSAETAKQMFNEMRLEELRQRDTNTNKSADTIPYVHILKEVKVAFPFVDTLSYGWMPFENSNKSVDTLPIIFYRSQKASNKSQRQQLYNFLRIRLDQDTVALIQQ